MKRKSPGSAPRLTIWSGVLRSRLGAAAFLACFGLSISVAAGPAAGSEVGSSSPETRENGDAFAAHAAAGLTAYQQHRFTDAARELEQAAALKTDPRMQILLASSYAEGGRLDEAIAEYQKVIDADPKNAEAYRGLGLVLLRKNDTGQSARALMKAVDLSPDDMEMHVALGKVLFLGMSRERARAEFDKVLEKEPNNAEGHAGLAACLHSDAQFEPAIREYLKALQLGHDSNTLFAALLTALQAYASAGGDPAPFVKQAMVYYPGNSTLQGLLGQASK